MRSDLSGKKFLIVDDEPDIRDFLRWEFEDRGGIVLEADGPATGEKVFQEEYPDFSLLDVRMPGGSGLDLLTRCKALRPESPVALMTGYTEVSPGRIYSQGACDLFVKPLKYNLLFPRIDKELLPLEGRYSVMSLPEVEATWSFEESLRDKYQKSELELGRGGFSTSCDRAISFTPGSYIKLKFAGVEFMVKYCWSEKEGAKKDQVHGFEWIHVPDTEKQWLLEKIKDLTAPAYIPMSFGVGLTYTDLV